MDFKTPKPDRRYSDSGRRTVQISGKSISAALSRLSLEDATRYRATHEIVISRMVTVRPGAIMEFDGKSYRVITVSDPKADDPVMKGRYLRLICIEV
jgi:hypothetical protein